MATQREVDGTGPPHLYIYPPGHAAPRPTRLTPPLTFGCLGDVRTGAAMLRGARRGGRRGTEMGLGGGRERKRGEKAKEREENWIEGKGGQYCQGG